MFDFATLVVLLCTFLISFYFYGDLFIKNRKRYPRGPWGFPVVGHLPLLGKFPTITFMKWQRKYGDIFQIRIGSWNTVVINGYSAVTEALTKGDAFSGRPSLESFRTFTRVLGDEMLVTAQVNPAYLQQRKLFTGSVRKITRTNMKSTQDLIIDETNKMIFEMSQKCTPRVIEEEIETLIGSIIQQILYGKEPNVKESEIFKAVDEFNKVNIRLARKGSPTDVLPWLKYVMPGVISKVSESLTKLDKLSKRLVKDHTEHIEEGMLNDVTYMFLSSHLPEHVEDKEMNLCKQRLMLSLIEFQSAGLETTSTALKWFILYMIAYPEVQAKMQREIDEVVGHNHRIDMEHITKLNYTVATIWEVMRITSIVPFALPHRVLMDTELFGFDIEQNTVAFLNLYSVHMDRSFWKDPETFRPDRLLNSNKEIIKDKIKRIIPFGIGRRRCAGEHLAKMQLFLIVCTLMQHCNFRKVPGKVIDFEQVIGITSSPKPYKVIIEQRHRI